MSVQRRTERLFDDLDAARIQGAVVALTGAGVSDALLLADKEGPRLRQRVAKALASWAYGHGMQTISYSQGWGAEYISAPGAPEPTGEPPGRRMLNPDEALAALIDEVRNSATPSTLVIDWTDILLQDNGTISDGQAVIIQRISHMAGDSLFALNGHFLVLLVRNGQLNRRLSEYPGVVTMPVPIPDEEERRVAIEDMAADPQRTLYLNPALSPRRAARVTGGLYLDDLLRLRSLSALSPVTEQQIVDRKTAAIRRQAGDTITVFDNTVHGDQDLAGLYQVKAALEDAELAGIPTVRLLLVGPPGVGKSRSHLFIANHRGEPAIALHHVRERWVGSSEERMERAWETIDALSPTCLELDECETELGRRSAAGDDASRTDSSLRAELFKRLGDTGTQSRGSVIAATNRIDLMDSAAVDRFIVVPVIHPVGHEVVDIMTIAAKRAGRPFDVETVARSVLKAPTMSGRHAVRLVDRAAVHAARRRSPVIEGSDMDLALSESMYRLSPAEVFHSLLAIRHCSFTPYLPWNAAAAHGQDLRWPDYMDGLINPDGSVRLDRLDARIDELIRTGAR